MTNPAESTLNTAEGTLTEFLLARIAEDEAEARAATGDHWERHLGGAMVADDVDNTWVADYVLSANDAAHIARHDPNRVLAECEAKRRIVTLMGYVRESWDNKHSGEGRVMWPDVNRREKSHALTILETLAAVYADHPDYREEWRP